MTAILTILLAVGCFACPGDSWEETQKKFPVWTKTLITMSFLTLVSAVLDVLSMLYSLVAS